MVTSMIREMGALSKRARLAAFALLGVLVVTGCSSPAGQPQAAQSHSPQESDSGGRTLRVTCPMVARAGLAISDAAAPSEFVTLARRIGRLYSEGDDTTKAALREMQSALDPLTNHPTNRELVKALDDFQASVGGFARRCKAAGSNTFDQAVTPSPGEL
jgi:hypothetical protein